MLRTTIYLDEETVLAVRQLAGQQQCSQADVIREALRRYLECQPEYPRPMPPGIGAYRSGRQDVSARAEDLLREAVRRRR